MVEKLDGRVGMHSVERVRYVLNNLVIVKYGVLSLVVCISTCLWFVQILMLLMKQLILFHADSCNKSYIYMDFHIKRNIILKFMLVPCTPMVPCYISLGYLIYFRMIKFYVLPICWQSVEEVAFCFNLQ